MVCEWHDRKLSRKEKQNLGAGRAVLDRAAEASQSLCAAWNSPLPAAHCRPPPRRLVRTTCHRTVDFFPRAAETPARVKFLCLLLAVLAFVPTPAQSAEKKHFVLYGMLLDTLPVDLADGAQWMMDKGDTFPVVMYKDQQTKIVLQLAGTSFIIDAKHVRVFEDKDLTAAALASYRRNVQTYIDTRSDQWKKRATGKQ